MVPKGMIIIKVVSSTGNVSIVEVAMESMRKVMVPAAISKMIQANAGSIMVVLFLAAPMTRRMLTVMLTKSQGIHRPLMSVSNW